MLEAGDKRGASVQFVNVFAMKEVWVAALTQVPVVVFAAAWLLVRHFLLYLVISTLTTLPLPRHLQATLGGVAVLFRRTYTAAYDPDLWAVVLVIMVATNLLFGSVIYVAVKPMYSSMLTLRSETMVRREAASPQRRRRRR